MNPEQMHGQARMMASLVKLERAPDRTNFLRWNDPSFPILDKELTRWNDIVQTAAFYNDPRAGLVEAIECCIIGHDMHVPKRGPLTMIEMFQ